MDIIGQLINNHVGNQVFALSVVSGSSLVVANMIVTRRIHDH